MNISRMISQINSWNDLKDVLEHATKQEKGKVFEELTYYYLTYSPKYRSKLKSVWLLKNTPTSVLKKLNIPLNDQGIDLLAETNDGEYWAIQCKYLQDEEKRLSHRAISTFVSLGTGIAKNITYCLVCTTSDTYADLYKGVENIGFCKSDEWNRLDKDFFDWVRATLAGKVKPLVPFTPMPHQQQALKEAKAYFIKQKNHRGKLVFPCGAGKSLTGYWICRELKAQRIIVAVPSLSLVKQTLEVYLRESVANKDKVEWICICSEEGIGKQDDIAIHTQDIGVPCITDKGRITQWLKDHRQDKTIIFTTYQSGRVIAEASKAAGISYDLGIMDEAHKTVGDREKLFSHLLLDENISIARRIFMTATERRYQGASDTILSMDDPDDYGMTFSSLSFKSAIESNILSDYKIITIFVSDKEVEDYIGKNVSITHSTKDADRATEARSLAALIALRKAMEEYPIHHAVSFHASISKAKAFMEGQETFSTAFPQFSQVDAFHVTGAMPTAVRSKIVEEFARSDKAIITNAKCLTEGVDVPNIDCVLFADPRKSTIDIVQAVGRALRRSPGKEFGYVLLPVYVGNTNKEDIVDSKEFKEVLSTLRALASNDERIIEYFRELSKGKHSSGNSGLVITGGESQWINTQEFIEAIELRVWDKLAKLSWMPFEEARAYVRGLGLKNTKDWNIYRKSENKPFDIPSNPNTIYRVEWEGWGNFLGTWNISNKDKVYRSFDEARAFARNLKLKSGTEWVSYCQSGKKPDDIPAKPNKTYKEEWNGIGDFIGTGNIATNDRVYRSFEEARAFARNLKLKSGTEWVSYCQSGKKPNDIPAIPNNTYKLEWKGIGDFLGTGNISNKDKVYRSFEEAREYVISLGLNNQSEWIGFCKSGMKPLDIPTSPENVYKNSGWLNLGDWLGTGAVSHHKYLYRSFIDARDFANSLKLKSRTQWYQYCASGNKPNDIPFNPGRTYKKKGWVSWGDWIGSGNIATFKREYRKFEEARKFVHALNFKGSNDWLEYCKSGKKPVDIPSNPDKTYANDGYVGLGDWLGTDIIATQNRQYLPFEEAKKFVNTLNIKNFVEWMKYSKSPLKPIDIPTNPNVVYKNSGWNNMGDWLGTGRLSTQTKSFRSFSEARKFVHSLKFKNVKQWQLYCVSGSKPDNIPSSPNLQYKEYDWKGWADFLGKE